MHRYVFMFTIIAMLTCTAQYRDANSVTYNHASVICTCMVMLVKLQNIPSD